MRNKRYIFMTMTIFWVAVIFFFSLQTGDVSSNISGSLLQQVLERFVPGVPKQEQLELWHTVLRKCAHFTEFFVLGVLNSLTLLQTELSRRGLIAMMFCLAVATMDEAIQLFVSGRAGRLIDVMIDGSGALVGIMMVFVGVWLVGYGATKRTTRRKPS